MKNPNEIVWNRMPREGLRQVTQSHDPSQMGLEILTQPQDLAPCLAPFSGLTEIQVSSQRHVDLVKNADIHR